MFLVFDAQVMCMQRIAGDHSQSVDPSLLLSPANASDIQSHLQGTAAADTAGLGPRSVEIPAALDPVQPAVAGDQLRRPLGVQVRTAIACSTPAMSSFCLCLP